MQRPTATNLRIRSAYDAHLLFHAVSLSILPSITRRLDSDERRALKSGNVYVWEERSANTEVTGLGIERFTEGRRWGPSRVREEFLFYYEKREAKGRIGDAINVAARANGAAGPYGFLSVYGGEVNSEETSGNGWDPMIKQTYSVWVEGRNGKRKWHLTAYFTQSTVDRLSTLDDMPELRGLQVPEGVYRSTRAGKVKAAGALAGVGVGGGVRYPNGPQGHGHPGGSHAQAEQEGHGHRYAPYQYTSPGASPNAYSYVPPAQSYSHPPPLPLTVPSHHSPYSHHAQTQSYSYSPQRSQHYRSSGTPTTSSTSTSPYTYGNTNSNLSSYQFGYADRQPQSPQPQAQTCDCADCGTPQRSEERDGPSLPSLNAERPNFNLNLNSNKTNGTTSGSTQRVLYARDSSAHSKGRKRRRSESDVDVLEDDTSAYTYIPIPNPNKRTQSGTGENGKSGSEYYRHTWLTPVEAPASTSPASNTASGTSSTTYSAGAYSVPPPPPPSLSSASTSMTSPRATGPESGRERVMYTTSMLSPLSPYSAHSAVSTSASASARSSPYTLHASFPTYQPQNSSYPYQQQYQSQFDSTRRRGSIQDVLNNNNADIGDERVVLPPLRGRWADEDKSEENGERMPVLTNRLERMDVPYPTPSPHTPAGGLLLPVSTNAAPTTDRVDTETQNLRQRAYRHYNTPPATEPSEVASDNEDELAKPTTTTVAPPNKDSAYRSTTANTTSSSKFSQEIDELADDSDDEQICAGVGVRAVSDVRSAPAQNQNQAQAGTTVSSV